MNKLILIRGLPGSGKSTLAKSLVDFHHVEADEYFVGLDGYKFEASEVKYAHAWCQHHAINALKMGRNVVVSNTFTQRWEMQPYIDAAKALGIVSQVITCHGEWENVHGVPAKKIEQMRARWEEVTA